MKIIATAAMLKERLERKRKGRIPSAPVIVPFPDIPDDPNDRVRVRRIRLAMQGNPLAYRSQGSQEHESAPTAQWLARNNGYVETRQIGSDVRIRGYRSKPITEQHADKFTDDMQNAMARFLQDASYANRVGIVDLNRAGGHSAPGSRLGGLGNVHQSIRDGHARHEWIERNMAPEFRVTAKALLKRELLKKDGSPFSLEDFGQHMFPSMKTKDFLRGSGAGALWGLAATLVHMYQVCPIRVTRITEEERRLEYSR